jgi:PAS domain S-box-containing protein
MGKSETRDTGKKGLRWFRQKKDMSPRDRIRQQAEFVEELTALLDVDRDTVIIRDMENRIVFWNRGAEDIFGWSKTHALGREYGELQGLSYPVPLEQVMRQLHATGRWEGEIAYEAFGRPPVFLDSRLCLQKDKKGVPVAILEIDNNITGRKNAEALLRSSEQHYRLLADSVSDLVGTIDLNMNFIYASNNAQRLVGYTAQEVMKKGLRGMLTPESFEAARQTIAQQLSMDKEPLQDPNRSFLIEAEIRHKDKSTRLYELKVVFQRDAGGRPVSLLGVGRDITERKSLERRLRENEQRYLSLLHNCHAIVFRAEINGRVQIFEGLAQEITGYSSEDFVSGKTVWEKIIFPDDGELLGSSWEKIRTLPDHSTEREYRIIRKDQQIRWVHEYIHNVCNGSGAPTFVEGTIYDITDHKKMNEELLWLASFPELNPNPIIEAGLEGTIYYMSPAALRLFPDIEKRGSKHPYLAGLHWVADRIIAERRQFFSREVELDGLWYAQKIYAVENNSRLRIYGVDITENKLISRRLRLINQQLMDTIEFLPDPTFVIDRNKRVIAWNRALEDLTGTKKEDMIGKGDYEYALPFYGKRRPIIIDLVFRSDKEIESRYSYVKRKNNTLVAEVFIPGLNNGKGMFVWIKVAPLYDENGVVVGGIESVRDITEHKESEAILRKDKEVFEELVHTKSQELLRVQKELVDAKHLSEIGALAATIAHELRNPLAAIRTAAYNIRRKAPESRLASHLDNIDKKVLESDQIINNLLSYARIKTPHLERVMIHGLLDECIKGARDRFLDHKVTVRKKCTCEKDDLIRADPLHMKELFNNVLNNAYESFDQKKGIITITAEYHRRGDFIVKVTDNGVGISPENIQKISGPFFTTKSKGTGLGLTVCYQLVHLHSGTITIASEVGKGTTVTITLPVGDV